MSGPGDDSVAELAERRAKMAKLRGELSVQRGDLTRYPDQYQKHGRRTEARAVERRNGEKI